MLWKWFFLLKLQTDLSDMKNYCYLLKIKLILRVNKTDVFWALSRVHDITSDMNNIFNNFLKIMNTSFIKMIIIFTQTFWNIFYYSKWFWTVCTVTLCKFEKSNYITFRIWRLIALLSMIEKIIKTVTVMHLK